ncbi:hypothetical protein [Pseudomonas sp. BBP2017]|uniref:hypothetical protein n=1 Tax=Pseudomonas sp. BBP2017 TaxID=2109731 RepID=UPI000D128F3E|nr:hypothetical protein [Pseudomonas sp. BBP2017]PSS59115.1 hypothetical protein C6382_01765 [Pseudomonas sp. BBP2017]
MWGYVALYVLFAGGVYCVDRFTHRSLFVRTQNRHLRWKLNFSVRGWDIDDYLAAVILVCVAILQAMMMLDWWGSSVDKNLARGLFALLSLSSIVLVVRLLRLVERYARHKGWLTVLAALLTVGAGLIASAEADAFILGQTRVDPGQFPVAQKTLTFIYLVYLWYLSTSLLMALVMFVGALIYGMTAPGFKQQVRRNRATAICRGLYIPSLTWHKRQWLQASCVIGVIYTAVILLAFSEVVNARLRTVLHEALVYASFHLRPEDCAMTGLPPGTRLALLAKGAVVVARPVEGGYRFDEQVCSLQSATQIETTRDQRIRNARAQDAYF